jgi:hypothetical protein
VVIVGAIMARSILAQEHKQRRRLKVELPMPQDIKERKNEEEKTRKTTKALLIL